MNSIFKIFIVFVFATLLEISAFCQTIPFSPNTLNELKQRTGQWTILYNTNWNIVSNADSASFYRIINFKNGKPDGKVTDYYLSGTKQWEGFLYSFKPDSSYGHAIYYYANGKKQSEGNYKENVLEGEWIYWFNNGKIQCEATYKKNYKDGRWNCWTQSGEKWIVDFEKNKITDIQKASKQNINADKNGQYEKDEELLLERLQIEKNIIGERDIEYLLTLDDLGRLYLENRNYEKAKAPLLKCLSGYEAILGIKSERYAWTLSTLGITFYGLGDFVNGDKYYKNCLETYNQIYGVCAPEMLKMLGNYIKQKSESDDVAEAEYFISEYLLKHQIDSCLFSKDLSDLYLTVFHLNLLLNYNDKAYPFLEKATAIVEKIYGINSSDYDDIMLEQIQFLLSLPADNERQDTTALEIVLKEYRKAKKKYGEVNKEIDIKYKPLIAEAYYLLGQYDEAINIYEELFHTPGYHVDSISFFTNMGLFSSEAGKYSNALEYYMKALSISERIKIGDRDMMLLNSQVATLYKQTNNLEKAEVFSFIAMTHAMNLYDKNIKFLSEEERSRLIRYSSAHLAYYGSIASKLYLSEPKVLNNLYGLILWRKGIIMNESERVMMTIKSTNDTVLQKTYNDWKNLKITLSASLQNDGIADGKVKKLETQVNQMEKELTKHTSIFLENQKIISWETIQQQLSPKDAMVEIISFDYDWTDTVYYAALILTSETTEYPKLVLLKNRNNLDSTYFLHYQQYITTLKQRDDKDWESYQYFWAAIDSAIGDKKTVYVSPDGVYNKINLETLVTPDGKYLSDSKDIRIIGSSRDLLQPVSPVKKSIKNALLVGNPNFKSSTATGDTALLAYNQTASDVFRYTTRSFDNTDISPLPAAEKEVESISHLLKKYNYQTTTLIGNAAQESTVKMAINPTVLHIATHGFFEKDINPEYNDRFMEMNRKRVIENPMLRSGLLLAGAEKTIKGNYDPKDGTENGILTAYEVQQMNLDSTELVVLSACETGLGEIKNGEGVYGLQRAFRIAGAKTIIMSLWKVDDEATQLLMTTFYENWLSGKTKREAFKSAQEILKKNPRYSHPYYWGAFVLIGE